MGAYDCDCINNLEYDRRERKQKEQSRSTAQSTARSTAQSTDLIDRQAAIDGKIVIQRTNGVEIYSDEAVPVEYLKNLPSRQPEPSTNCSEIPNSSDTISRQAAIDEIKSVYEWHDTVTMERLIEHLNNLPPIQPERKKGEWSDGYRWQRCSLCKQTGKKSWNFCPNCGADMRGEKDG